MKCWLNPGEEDAKRKEMAALSAPPPMAALSAAAPGAGVDTVLRQTGAPPLAPGLGATTRRLGVAARYAAMPTLTTTPSTDGSGADALVGIKPPFLGLGTRPNSAPGIMTFRPAVFQPGPVAQTVCSEGGVDGWCVAWR